MSDERFIMLKNVRVSFPHLFTRPIIRGQEGKCGAQIMLDNERDAKSIEAVKRRIQELIKDKLKGARVPADKLCLRAGEDKGRAEYEGHHILSANNTGKPFVISNNGRDMITDPEDNPIYAGCYVNAKIQLWAQDNDYGKRINCTLVAIQFSADGDALDGAHVSAADAVEGFDMTAGDEDFLAA